MMMLEPWQWPRARSRPSVLAPARARTAVVGTVYTTPDGPTKHTSQPGAPAIGKEQAAQADLGTQQVAVLIAEDEETIAETLAMLVEDAGCLPIVARDGREALALARQHRPRLIITDLMMPFLTGADLIAAVRRDADAEGAMPPPVIVVTAASRARAEEAGANVVIFKPFDVAKIEAAMLRLLPDDRR